MLDGWLLGAVEEPLIGGPPELVCEPDPLAVFETELPPIGLEDCALREDEVSDPALVGQYESTANQVYVNLLGAGWPEERPVDPTTVEEAPLVPLPTPELDLVLDLSVADDPVALPEADLFVEAVLPELRPPLEPTPTG